MKRRCSVTLILALTCFPSPQAAPDIKPGDILFQTSKSSQSQAIQLATHSPYSHMGLVVSRAGVLYVLEAEGRVQLTPLPEWTSRGQGGAYVVKRLKNPGVLSASGLARLTQTALKFLGLPYDPYFEWSDDRFYCSELVWKAYDRALGIQLGDLTTLSAFDLSNPIVKQKLLERFGGQVPANEKVISPASMFASPLLETIEVRR
jgi:hypothetical protein